MSGGPVLLRLADRSELGHRTPRQHLGRGVGQPLPTRQGADPARLLGNVHVLDHDGAADDPGCQRDVWRGRGAGAGTGSRMARERRVLHLPPRPLPLPCLAPGVVCRLLCQCHPRWPICGSGRDISGGLRNGDSLLPWDGDASASDVCDQGGRRRHRPPLPFHRGGAQEAQLVRGDSRRSDASEQGQLRTVACRGVPRQHPNEALDNDKPLLH
mmetsp:Transcript_1421/g.3452  ORF Transcript_1421/g.3452 Transcript_1421/m.3452 type:complete len:213 (+) Transcript_1421:340-978(+)